MSISSIEHVESKEALIGKLLEIKNGLRKNGVVCLIMNSNIKEVDKETNEVLSVQFEINIETEELITILKDIFSEFKEIKHTIINQRYDIPRGEKISDLTTRVVTYVARKI